MSDEFEYPNIELASVKPRIEKTIQGNIILHDIPETLVPTIQDELKKIVATENKFAHTTLVQSKVSHKSPVYSVAVQAVMKPGNRATMRFIAGYNGPKSLPISASTKIFSTRPLLVDWLNRKVEYCTDKVVKMMAVKPEHNGYLDLVAKSNWTEVKAKVSSHQMSFLIVPKDRRLLPALDRFMPTAIDNIAIEKIATNSNQFIAFRTATRDKAFLDKVGSTADHIIEKVMRG